MARQRHLEYLQRAEKIVYDNNGREVIKYCKDGREGIKYVGLYNRAGKRIDLKNGNNGNNSKNSNNANNPSKQQTLTQMYTPVVRDTNASNLCAHERIGDEDGWNAPIYRDQLSGRITDPDVLAKIEWVGPKFYSVIIDELMRRWPQLNQYFSIILEQLKSVLDGKTGLVFWEGRADTKKPMSGEQVVIKEIGIINAPAIHGPLGAKVEFVQSQRKDTLDMRVITHEKNIPCKCVTFKTNKWLDLTEGSFVVFANDLDYCKDMTREFSEIKWYPQDLKLTQKADHLIVARVESIKFRTRLLARRGKPAAGGRFDYNLNLIGVFNPNHENEFTDVNDENEECQCEGVTLFAHSYELKQVKCGHLCVLEDGINTDKSADKYACRFVPSAQNAGQNCDEFDYAAGDYIQHADTKIIYKIVKRKNGRQVGYTCHKVDEKPSKLYHLFEDTLLRTTKILDWTGVDVQNQLAQMVLTKDVVGIPSYVRNRPSVDAPKEPDMAETERCPWLRQSHKWDKALCLVKKPLISADDEQISWDKLRKGTFRMKHRDHDKWDRPDRDQCIEYPITARLRLLEGPEWIKYEEGIVCQIGTHLERGRTQGNIVMLKFPGVKVPPSNKIITSVIVDSAACSRVTSRRQCMFYAWYFYFMFVMFDFMCGIYV